ncbi:eukaryotic translation initiation factor 3k [Haematococcus lacustris]
MPAVIRISHNATQCRACGVPAAKAGAMMQLRGAERYQVDKAKLEANVNEQIAAGSFNLDVNLALLRHYQFQPTTAQISSLAKVLMAALAQLPASDYKTCIHLVPERLQAEEVIPKIVALAAALETTRFTDFWALAANSKEVISLVPGFEAAVRRYILHVLGLSFQRVSRRVLGEALQLQGAELDSLISSQVASAGWQAAGDIVTLPRNDSNSQVVVKRAQEAIRFDQVAPVLRSVTVGL